MGLGDWFRRKWLPLTLLFNRRNVPDRDSAEYEPLTRSTVGKSELMIINTEPYVAAM